MERPGFIMPLTHAVLRDSGYDSYGEVWTETMEELCDEELNSTDILITGLLFTLFLFLMVLDVFVTLGALVLLFPAATITYTMKGISCAYCKIQERKDARKTET